MADDERDKRRPHTPPKGVESQLAKPMRPPTPIPGVVGRTPGVILPPTSKTPISDATEPDSWEDQSGGGRAVTAVRPKVEHESPIETLVRHSGATVNTTFDIAVKVDKLENRIDSAHEKIDAIFPVLADLRVDSAVQKTQNVQILKKLDDQDQQKKQTEYLAARTKSADIVIAKERTLSDIEIEEHDKLAKIATQTARETAEIDLSKEKRKVWLTTAAKVVGALALLALGYLAKKCGV